MAICPNRLSKGMSVGRNIIRRRINAKNNIPCMDPFMLSNYCQTPEKRKPVSEKGSRLMPSLPRRLDICIQITYQSVKHLNESYIQPHNSCQCSTQTRGHQEKTHCPCYRFRCLFLDLCSIGRQMGRHHGSQSAPTLPGLVKDTPRSICRIVHMQ